MTNVGAIIAIRCESGAQHCKSLYGDNPAVAMPRIPDLVLDSKLETRFASDEYTCHFYNESGTTSRQRTVQREEYWKRQKHIGGGSYGSVWLEECIQGRSEVQLRAVKQITKPPTSSRLIDCYRELEAIAKFSHPKVGSSTLPCICLANQLLTQQP